MNQAVAKIFSQVVLSERTINIKLLGDSITHGAGGTGFEQNGELIVDGFSRNPDGYCWAKLFKGYMESQFDCAVTNNGCCGVKIEFIIDNFEFKALQLPCWQTFNYFFFPLRRLRWWALASAWRCLAFSALAVRSSRAVLYFSG